MLKLVERAVDLDFLETLERRASTRRRSAIAKQGFPYSLIRPSVDQVSDT